MTEQDILDRGIELIAISFVDGAGLTRARSITAAGAEAAARPGVGASESLSNFTGEDILATATGYEATGDVRLLPDLGRLAAASTAGAGRPAIWSTRRASRGTSARDRSSSARSRALPRQATSCG